MGWDPQVEELFHGACSLDASVSPAEWLEERCGSNGALFAEVQSLLAARAAMTAHSLQATAKGPMPTQAAERVPEAQFGAYRAVALLGRGGTSAVYSGRRADGQFERAVAIKVLAQTLAGPDFLRNFHREQQLLAGLDHPGIPRLLDGGVSSHGDPYLITELVQGEPVDSYCDRRKLGVEARLRLMLDVCEVVDFAHRHLTVHRDLKPAHILVTVEGAVRLLDFGAAALAATHAGATATRARMCTARYASPEQLRGERAQVASDVFSLGVVAYELLTGAWPFGNPDSVLVELERAMGRTAPLAPGARLSEAQAHGRSTSRDQLARVLKADLGAILLKCLAQDEAARYATVRDLAYDLRRYLEGKPVAARRSTILYRARKFAGRNRWRLAAALAIVAALAAAARHELEVYGRDQRLEAELRQLDQASVGEILEEVGKLPGSSKARLMIAEHARQSLNRLWAEWPDSRETQRTLAEAYIQFANVQGEPFAISLGDNAGALESYRKAEALAAKLNASKPEDAAVLVRARQGIAEMEIRAGHYGEAAAMARRSLDAARRLWESGARIEVGGRSPGFMYVRMHVLLGHAMMRAAEWNRNAGQARQALDEFRQAVSLATEARRRDPGMPDLAARYSEYVGYGLETLSELTGDRQYLEEAIPAFERPIAASRAQFAAAPTPKAQRDLADALIDLGVCHQKAHHWAAAIAPHEEAVKLLEPVYRADPESGELRLELAVAYDRLGMAEVGAGQAARALDPLRRAESLIELPHPVAPTDREIVTLYVENREHIALASMALGDGAGAAKKLAEALQPLSGGGFLPPHWVRQLESEYQRAQAQAGKGR
jgi:non-specific serine/threonine protein kinase/serine/threonine-protein kinase